MKKPTTTAAEVFATELREWTANEDKFQEILRRMCRSLTDAQGNLLSDFLFVNAPEDRAKIHRHFMKLLDQELTNQHDYQHEHQGKQDPP